MRPIQLFSTVLVLGTVGIVQLLVGLDAQGQEIPRDEYLRYIPLEYPTIVRQTEANAELHLFGNTEDEDYQDTSPVDGIDDRRHKVLLDLAVEFAPYLVLNSTMIPMDFRLFMRREEAFRLFVDRWNVSIDPPKFIGSEEINWQALSCPTSKAGPREACTDIPDCRLFSLLEEFDPFAPGEAYRSGAVVPKGVEHKVMFFDFPGDGEETWKQEYVNQISKALPRSYERFAKVFVHPFVESVESSVTGHQGYAFVLQYWFFYPYNDGGNNHEGDWEHINVFIKPLDQLHEPLREADVCRILTEGVPSDSAPDRLVIQRVDYYFHHNVMTLDYTRPDVYQSREKWQTELENTRKERAAEEWIWQQIRDRAYWDDDETIINTHPIGFIGGDNKGTDQLLKPPGGSNRVSNGTYPFPGLYKNVGPAGAAEQISMQFDHRKSFAAGDDKRGIPKGGYRRGSVVSFALCDQIEILPDGERVVNLVKTDARTRQDWAWLVLPIRWGYPATESPFAGAIAHTDLGNSSVMGPSYNAGWNRTGDAPGFQVYLPNTFNSLYNLAWQDNFINNLGYLNVPVSALMVLPPFDMVWCTIRSLRLLWGKQDRIFQPDGPIPPRFIGLWTFGVTHMPMSPDFVSVRLYPKQMDAVRQSHANTDTKWMFVQENTDMLHAEITFYLGERFASQNSLRFGNPVIGYDLTSPALREVLRVRGILALLEYSGSLRYNLTTGNFMMFVKGGYDLSLYRFVQFPTNIEWFLYAGGDPFTDSEIFWIGHPVLRRSLGRLPNTWHFGGGIEWMSSWNIKSKSRPLDLMLVSEARHSSIGALLELPLTRLSSLRRVS